MIIGGHPGLEVSRENGRIVKRAQDVTANGQHHANVAALRNEARMLRAMSDSGFAPELLDQGPDWIAETDVGESGAPTDENALRRNCTRFLWTLRRRGVRHGDLTSANIIFRDNWPLVVDWQESHFLEEPAPQKQPWSDSALLMRTLSGLLDSARVARRWAAVLAALGADRDFALPLAGKTLLDLGCFQGDFTALAVCDGMRAVGVDQGGFRSGEDSIEIARSLWAGMGCEFRKADIMDMPDFRCDVALLFSTWPYVVQDHGREWAEALLGRIVADAGVLFFETQVAGDGPGPEWLRGDDDVRALLERFGAAEPIVTVPVTGRDASRTVWKVSKKGT